MAKAQAADIWRDAGLEGSWDWQGSRNGAAHDSYDLENTPAVTLHAIRGTHCRDHKPTAPIHVEGAVAVEEAGYSGHTEGTERVTEVYRFPWSSAALVEEEEEPVAVELVTEKRAGMPAVIVAIPEAEEALAGELVQALVLPRASFVSSAPAAPSQTQPAARRGSPRWWTCPSTGSIVQDRDGTHARHPQRAGLAERPCPVPVSHRPVVARGGRRVGPISRGESCR